MDTTKEDRKIWIDATRACAALLVVLLHTAAPYLYKIKELEIESWLIGNYVDSFTRASVPLFFMISGYLFFQAKKPSMKNYARLLSALFFYSMLALIYLSLYRGQSVYEPIVNIASKPVFYHLWFFYTLLVIYLFANVIHVRKIENIYTALALFCIFFILLNPKLASIMGLMDFDVGIKSRFQLDGNIVYYLMYAAFGAILGTIKVSLFSRRARYALLFLFIGSSLVIGYGTYVLSVSAGKYIGTFYHYGSVPVAIGAASLFLYIRTCAFSGLKLKWAIDIIAKSSLVMYGVHALILDYIRREGYRDYSSPTVDIVSVFLFTVVVSILISKLIQRVDRKGLVS